MMDMASAVKGAMYSPAYGLTTPLLGVGVGLGVGLGVGGRIGGPRTSSSNPSMRATWLGLGLGLRFRYEVRGMRCEVCIRGYQVGLGGMRYVLGGIRWY